MLITCQFCWGPQAADALFQPRITIVDTHGQSPWRFSQQFKLRLTPFGRFLIHPRAKPMELCPSGLLETIYQRIRVILSEAKNLLDSSSSVSRRLLRMTLVNNFHIKLYSGASSYGTIAAKGCGAEEDILSSAFHYGNQSSIYLAQIRYKSEKREVLK